MTTITDQAWRARAACIPHPIEMFFPDANDRPAIEAAKRICATCPVHADCLATALADGDTHGIRGGLTVRERRRIARDGGTPLPRVDLAVITHGTTAGYYAHRRRHETPCRACKAAHAERKSERHLVALPGGAA